MTHTKKHIMDVSLIIKVYFLPNAISSPFTFDSSELIAASAFCGQYSSSLLYEKLGQTVDYSSHPFDS
jgi:hypothetical protein